MNNPTLDRYLDDVRKHLKGMPRKEQAETLEEMRSHLEEDIAGRMSKKPAMTLDQATLDATHDFGEPAEIAQARAATMRTTTKRRLPLGVKIGVAVVAVLLLAWVTAAIVDETTTKWEPNIYDRSTRYAGQSGVENSTFYVPYDVARVTFDVHIHNEDPNATGCLSIRVTDPSGIDVFDTGGSCGVLYQNAVFQGTGLWKIQYSFTEFVGHVDVTVRKG